MAVVRIPPDGAAKRFKASQENLVAEKQQLMERTSNPRDKIKIADAIKSLKEHDGWKVIQMWYTTKWSFKSIMDAFRAGKEDEYKNMMIQRELLEMIESQMDTWIDAGQKARDLLAEQEKASKH